ncbi:MAG: 2-dehydro-3-deoxygalactonokinase [Firmicutes bacterium]|nr:2-dehydro-3-deoxygalactonokinase [Bacillota bacterium]
MSYLLTIDGGTTNTRYTLWDQTYEIIGTYRQDTGVRVSAVTGSTEAYRQNIAEGLQQILTQNQIPAGEIGAIYASGMITSSLGLQELPHVPAPAGIEELAAAVRTINDPKIFPGRIHLIPGVKNNVSGKTSDSPDGFGMDMMRGEETEVIALLAKLSNNDFAGQDTGSMPSPSRLIILPGSHNKFIWVSPKGKIEQCRTTLSGELIDALSHHTILADAVEHTFAPSHFESKYLLAGAEAADTKGLTAALFETRIYRMFDGLSAPQAGTFLLGAVLEEDLKACLGRSAPTNIGSLPKEIIVAGKDPLRSAIVYLMKKKNLSLVREYISEGKPLAAYGALLLAREKGDF